MKKRRASRQAQYDLDCMRIDYHDFMKRHWGEREEWEEIVQKMGEYATRMEARLTARIRRLERDNKRLRSIACPECRRIQMKEKSGDMDIVKLEL